MSVANATLARRTMGTAALISVGMVASSPQTVLNGGLPTMYTRSGVQGVPLSFLILMVVFSLLAVGYVAVSRHVPHGAPFYAQLAQGLNPTWGLVAAGVAWVGYNCLQISLFPLIGTSMAAMFGGAWWIWALVAWLGVLLLGQYPGAANAKVLGVLLACEVGIVLAFDVAAFADPAEGTIGFGGFAPANLLVVGGGASVLIFAAAAFTGGEGAPAFAEEARSPTVVVLATFGTFLLLGVLYALSAWAYETALGPGQLHNAGLKTNAPMVILRDMWGPGLGMLGSLLLITSVVAAQSAFSGIVARYTFALGREKVLPAFFAAVTPGADGGAPKGGSAGQAVTSAAVVAGFVACDAAPMKAMFVWLSTIGAVCVLILLTLSSFAAVSFFNKGLGGGEAFLIRQGLPFVGGVVGILSLAFMLPNLTLLLGLPAGSNLPWLIAVVLGTVTAVAALGGGWLKRHRPEVYDGIGRGTPDPVTVKDARFEGLQL